MTKLIIPKGTEEIEEDEYVGDDEITEVVIPSSVKVIGDHAFENCENLEEVTISDGVEEIGYGVFRGCESLWEIHIPKSVKSMESQGFIDASITVDPENPYLDCRDNCHAVIETKTNRLVCGTNDTVIPESVTSIGHDAFYGCPGLTSITIPESVTSIGEFAFGECYHLESIVIPKSVTAIYERTFYMCEKLESITIPASVKSIAPDAFLECSPKLTVYLSQDSTISEDDEAFANCEVIRIEEDTTPNQKSTITIPKGKKKIIEKEFQNREDITSVVIPDSVTEIGCLAFSGCTGLTSITIPESVTKIGVDAFDDCTGLTSITVDTKNPVFDSRDNSNAIIETKTNILVCGCKATNIPDSVTKIGRTAFYGCTGLKEITIPDSVTEIESFAFNGCTGLTSIDIPNSVTEIGYAFRGCTGLTTVILHKPKGKIKIDKDAFEDCGKVKFIVQKPTPAKAASPQAKKPAGEGAAAATDAIPVIMTGSPKKFGFATKADFLAQHPEYVETTEWKQCKILFTDDLASTSSKMKKAESLGIEIKTYGE